MSLQDYMFATPRPLLNIELRRRVVNDLNLADPTQLGQTEHQCQNEGAGQVTTRWLGSQSHISPTLPFEQRPKPIPIGHFRRFSSLPDLIGIIRNAWRPFSHHIGKSQMGYLSCRFARLGWHSYKAVPSTRDKDKDILGAAQMGAETPRSPKVIQKETAQTACLPDKRWTPKQPPSRPLHKLRPPK